MKKLNKTLLTLLAAIFAGSVFADKPPVALQLQAPSELPDNNVILIYKQVPNPITSDAAIQKFVWQQVGILTPNIQSVFIDGDPQATYKFAQAEVSTTNCLKDQKACENVSWTSNTGTTTIRYPHFQKWVGLCEVTVQKILASNSAPVLCGLQAADGGDGLFKLTAATGTKKNLNYPIYQLNLNNNNRIGFDTRYALPGVYDLRYGVNGPPDPKQPTYLPLTVWETSCLNGSGTSPSPDSSLAVCTQNPNYSTTSTSGNRRLMLYNQQDKNNALIPKIHLGINVYTSLMIPIYLDSMDNYVLFGYGHDTIGLLSVQIADNDAQVVLGDIGKSGVFAKADNGTVSTVDQIFQPQFSQDAYCTDFTGKVWKISAGEGYTYPARNSSAGVASAKNCQINFPIILQAYTPAQSITWSGPASENWPPLNGTVNAPANYFFFTSLGKIYASVSDWNLSWPPVINAAYVGAGAGNFLQGAVTNPTGKVGSNGYYFELGKMSDFQKDVIYAGCLSASVPAYGMGGNFCGFYTRFFGVGPQYQLVDNGPITASFDDSNLLTATIPLATTMVYATDDVNAWLNQNNSISISGLSESEATEYGPYCGAGDVSICNPGYASGSEPPVLNSPRYQAGNGVFSFTSGSLRPANDYTLSLEATDPLEFTSSASGVIANTNKYQLSAPVFDKQSADSLSTEGVTVRFSAPTLSGWNDTYAATDFNYGVTASAGNIDIPQTDIGTPSCTASNCSVEIKLASVAPVSTDVAITVGATIKNPSTSFARNWLAPPTVTANTDYQIPTVSSITDLETTVINPYTLKVTWKGGDLSNGDQATYKVSASCQGNGCVSNISKVVNQKSVTFDSLQPGQSYMLLVQSANRPLVNLASTSSTTMPNYSLADLQLGLSMQSQSISANSIKVSWRAQNSGDIYFEAASGSDVYRGPNYTNTVFKPSVTYTVKVCDNPGATSFSDCQGSATNNSYQTSDYSVTDYTFDGLSPQSNGVYTICAQAAGSVSIEVGSNTYQTSFASVERCQSTKEYQFSGNFALNQSSVAQNSQNDQVSFSWGELKITGGDGNSSPSVNYYLTATPSSNCNFIQTQGDSIDSGDAAPYKTEATDAVLNITSGKTCSVKIVAKAPANLAITDKTDSFILGMYRFDKPPTIGSVVATSDSRQPTITWSPAQLIPSKPDMSSGITYTVSATDTTDSSNVFTSTALSSTATDYQFTGGNTLKLGATYNIKVTANAKVQQDPLKPSPSPIKTTYTATQYTLSTPPSLSATDVSVNYVNNEAEVIVNSWKSGVLSPPNNDAKTSYKVSICEDESQSNCPWTQAGISTPSSSVTFPSSSQSSFNPGVYYVFVTQADTVLGQTVSESSEKAVPIYIYKFSAPPTTPSVTATTNKLEPIVKWGPATLLPSKPDMSSDVTYTVSATDTTDSSNVFSSKPLPSTDTDYQFTGDKALTVGATYNITVTANANINGEIVPPSPSKGVPYTAKPKLDIKLPRLTTDNTTLTLGDNNSSATLTVPSPQSTSCDTQSCLVAYTATLTPLWGAHGLSCNFISGHYVALCTSHLPIQRGDSYTVKITATITDGHGNTATDPQSVNDVSIK